MRQKNVIFINISFTLPATSTKDKYASLIQTQNTQIKGTDQRMKTIYQDEKDFCVMPDVPSWACVASAICIRAFSFLLNRILTL